MGPLVVLGLGLHRDTRGFGFSCDWGVRSVSKQGYLSGLQDRSAPIYFCPCMYVSFLKLGVFIGGPHNKDYRILGFILRSPSLEKLPIYCCPCIYVA